jgi:hypothetical protein
MIRILLALVTIVILLSTEPAQAVPVPLTFTSGSLHIDFDAGAFGSVFSGPDATLMVPKTVESFIEAPFTSASSTVGLSGASTLAPKGQLTLVGQQTEAVTGTLQFTGGPVTFHDNTSPFVLTGLLTDPATGTTFTVTGGGEALAAVIGGPLLPNGGIQGITFTLASVPEPSGLLLFTSGLLLLAGGRWLLLGTGLTGLAAWRRMKRL